MMFTGEETERRYYCLHFRAIDQKHWQVDRETLTQTRDFQNFLY